MSPAINFRVSEAERDEAEKAAAAQGKSLSDFAREALASAVVESKGLTKDVRTVARHIAGMFTDRNVPIETIERYLREGVPVKGKKP